LWSGLVAFGEEFSELGLVQGVIMGSWEQWGLFILQKEISRGWFWVAGVLGDGKHIDEVVNKLMECL